MEQAGLVLGNIAMSSFLTTCLDGCNYVTLDAQHGGEFNMAFTKLLLLRGWLTAVGSTVRGTSSANHPPAMQAQLEYQKQVVRVSVESLRRLLQHSKKYHEKSGLKIRADRSEGVVHVGEMAAIEPAFYETEGAVPEQDPYSDSPHLSSFTKTAPGQAQTLEHHRNVEAHIADLDNFVNRLDYLLQYLGLVDDDAMQVELVERAMEAIPEPASIRLLLQASGSDSHVPEGIFPTAAAAGAANFAATGLAEPTKLASHQYIRNLIKEQAMTVMGDVGHVNGSARSFYQENEMSGRSQAVLGNVDGAFGVGFFGRTQTDKS
ncbi:hypothetical protein AYO21_02753 [Fonsecaea monophora]|uniref:Prion-inhibition and propagation HeLo domain-containing protein n=1 Tax=Fonsecaea monophora TaxID=254056 RepID=A0A177FFQ9_9EURO|nr:hypothetical protein AYO21_02753 [Fonsecaea monophora]OAG43134.1 hypothetical protein AYO21_02753 [Fonsecaea monophora]